MRTLPVADGVLKHQIYFTQPGGNRMVNPAVVTLWSWDAAGSPASGARITDEQDAIEAWVRGGTFRSTMSSDTTVTDIRTWDYGLDPAPRTPRFLFPYTYGSVGGAIVRTNLASGWIVALRSQPVGSPIRDRLNGRITHPYAGVRLATAQYFPLAADVAGAYGLVRSAVLDGTGTKGLWCVVSFYAGGAPRVTPDVILVDHVICERMGTQRRRNARPGPYAIGS